MAYISADSFIGPSENDRYVLLKLDDKTLTRLCRESRYIASLCNNDFWLQKLEALLGRRVKATNPKALYTELAKLGTADDRLAWAAEKGHTDVVRALLNSGADVHAEDDYALRISSSNGHYDTVRLLLNNDADVHAIYDEALRLASEHGLSDIVKLLLDNGADVHAEEDEAVRMAEANGFEDVVRLLLYYGAYKHR